MSPIVAKQRKKCLLEEHDPIYYIEKLLLCVAHTIILFEKPSKVHHLVNPNGPFKSPICHGSHGVYIVNGFDP